MNRLICDRCDQPIADDDYQRRFVIVRAPRLQGSKSKYWTDDTVAHLDICGDCVGAFTWLNGRQT